jgi:Flagellar hook-length control protein FliK
MVIAPPNEVLPVPGSARPTLSAALAGKVIEARLTLALADGLFRFSSPEGEIDLPLPRHLPPGTQVRIAPQPNGSFQVTVLNEENLPLPGTARPLPASNPQPGSTPPLTTIVHPKSPIALPQGQEMTARVTSNPQSGLVRVATPQGEIDLPLPRPVPVGTPLRITPEPQGAVRVSIPEIPARAQSSVDAAPQKPTVHPTVFTSKPETVPLNIPLGRVVEARVLPSAQQGANQGMVRFVGPEGEFQLPLPRELPTGTQARIVAQPNGSVVVTMRPEIAQPPGVQSPMQAAQPNPVTAAAPQILRAVTLPPGPSVPVLPAGRVIEATISGQPARTPGSVRLSTPLGEFELPLPQHQTLPPGTPVRIAPQPNGGLTVVPMADGADAAAPLALKNPQPATPAEAIRQTVRTAVLKQDGLANVFADIEALPLRSDAPRAVRRAAEALLDQRVSLDDVIKPEQLAKAIAGSGIFAERTLSQLPPMQTAPPDLKLALFVLRAALGNWTRTDNLPTPQSVLPIHPETVPPPPTPTAPPSAQSPAEPSHMKGGQLSMQALAAEEFVPHLVRDTDAALARLNLHQIASLPDDRGGAARADAPDARWSAEIPVNIDGRTAVFGFVIERDGRQAQAEREKRRWRFRAALDLPDTGAIEADVRLQGTHVSAGIVAEEEETVALLEAALPLLRDGLTAQGFDVEVLSVRKGKGTPPPAPPGYFMDRRT